MQSLTDKGLEMACKKLDNAIVSKDLLRDVVANIEYNKIIIDYYKDFISEPHIAFSTRTLEKNTNRLSNCNRVWELDKYEKHKIKDFKRTNLCRDKFCSNCKRVKQSARMVKYIPELEKYQDRLYHLTLTLPNCDGLSLLPTHKKMAKAFQTLIRYLDCRLKVKGIDFTSWGYQGAVRSLEVTFKGDSYHPHYHIGLVLDMEQGKKKIQNTYSFDYRSGVKELRRLFSEQEILIQKIWYLLLNDIKVTKKSISDLKEGYSCTLDKFSSNDYQELFKYMTKEVNESGEVLTYENFITLYYSLYRVKQIQGYGVLYKITDDGDLEGMEKEYEEYIQEIAKKESPTLVSERPQDLLLDTEYTLISRKNYFKFLRQLNNSTKVLSCEDSKEEVIR